MIFFKLNFTVSESSCLGNIIVKEIPRTHVKLAARQTPEKDWKTSIRWCVFFSFVIFKGLFPEHFDHTSYSTETKLELTGFMVPLNTT